MVNRPFLVVAILSGLCAVPLLLSACQAVQKKKVTSQADLPRFTYPIEMPASQLVQADKATFDRFAASVRADLDRVNRDYDISDKATQRELLGVGLDLQQLAGDDRGALETVTALRQLEDKPSARLVTGLLAKSEAEAAIAARDTTGAAFEQAFTKSYSTAVGALPWDVVQDSMKASWAQARLASRAALIAVARSDLDPAVAKSHSLNNAQAWQLVDMRKSFALDLPLITQRAGVLGAYVTAHNIVKPDIWAAREVTLTPRDALTPVLVGIWDQGVDVSIFGDNVFSDTHATASGTHGLAFLDDGGPSQSWLYPLTPAQQSEYPTFRDELQGRVDLESGIDSPEAQALMRRMQSYTPEQLHERRELQKILGGYACGGNLGAGQSGNPAGRCALQRSTS